MSKKIQKQRVLAVQRYKVGESPQSICASLGKTKPWLYKWVSRYTSDDHAWCEGQSRRPLTSPYRTPAEIEEIVEMVRLRLYNNGLFCGNQAIQWEMTDMEIQPIPSLSTIGRILSRRSLTHRRTGRYEPMPSKAAQSIINAVYAVWKRMGIPENMQVDNEVAFFGSPAYPRGMGPLIRLCLHYGVNLWFIPPSEPWWNGVVEKFNDHYRQKFLAKITMASMPMLRQESLAFEHRHNSTYRYSKIKGKTPFKALASMDKKLVFPTGDNAPRYPLDKPVEGCYHFVRFIRSDLRLNIFGEMFNVPPET